MMITQKHRICVCICTHKRPERLARLLARLEKQATEDLFDYQIVIVDNDKSESARDTAERCAQRSAVSVSYYVEPEQNIALARNKAIQNATGDFIALIDDDESPDEQWLMRLYHAMSASNASGILGPVLPDFEERPPAWVLKGRFFDRPNHPTGHVLAWTETRTGNALLRRTIFGGDRHWFDPAFGSGGEDRDFFRRQIGEGHVFLWCEEAAVFESVSPTRWKRTVLLKRALLRGKMALNAIEPKRVSVLRSAAAVVIYAACLPLCCILGHHVFMKYLIKTCDHLGKLLAFAGIDFVREQYVGG